MLKTWGLAALLLVPCAAQATAGTLTNAQVFDLYVQVVVHGDATAQSALARYLDADKGAAIAAAFASVSRLDSAPEMADWPQAAAALRARQASVRCTIDSVQYPLGPDGDNASVDYRCTLPDLVALLPVYRQQPVPFNGPHPPQMAPALAAAYTQMIADAPTRERTVTLAFERDRSGRWRADPSPLMGTLADAFLPFFEWNEHPPGEDH
ncbi:MAG: hypothetical protein RR704_15340 [Stenotrophomonas sp.]